MRAMIASSGKIYSGYTGVTPITTDVAGRPRCWYSATKLLAESGAEVLAHADDIGRQVKVICARFGKHAPINIRSSPSPVQRNGKVRRVHGYIVKPLQILACTHFSVLFLVFLKQIASLSATLDPLAI